MGGESDGDKILRAGFGEHAWKVATMKIFGSSSSTTPSAADYHLAAESFGCR
jgi:hypothetical protein